MALQDFAVFASIEATEYIDQIFKRNSVYGSPRLLEFENIVNREMWCVIFIFFVQLRFYAEHS